MIIIIQNLFVINRPPKSFWYKFLKEGISQTQLSRFQVYKMRIQHHATAQGAGQFIPSYQ